eukprot:scaffold9980_cov121-Isochrysis_galbana.AAC.3
MRMTFAILPPGLSFSADRSRNRSSRDMYATPSVLQSRRHAPRLDAASVELGPKLVELCGEAGRWGLGARPRKASDRLFLGRAVSSICVFYAYTFIIQHSHEHRHTSRTTHANSALCAQRTTQKDQNQWPHRSPGSQQSEAVGAVSIDLELCGEGVQGVDDLQDGGVHSMSRAAREHHGDVGSALVADEADDQGAQVRRQLRMRRSGTRSVHLHRVRRRSLIPASADRWRKRPGLWGRGGCSRRARHLARLGLWFLYRSSRLIDQFIVEGSEPPQHTLALGVDESRLCSPLLSHARCVRQVFFVGASRRLHQLSEARALSGILRAGALELLHLTPQLRILQRALRKTALAVLDKRVHLHEGQKLPILLLLERSLLGG